MKVIVTMVDETKLEFDEVEGVDIRTYFDRIVIFERNWTLRTVIPTDSFISYTEED